MIKEAIAYYHSLLEENIASAKESDQWLKARMEAKNIKFGTRLVNTFLRPHFISYQQYDLIRKVSYVLLSCFARVENVMAEDPSLIDEVGLAEQERALARLEHGYYGLVLFARLDAFMTESELKFVEFNVDSPGGLAYIEEMSNLFLELPAMRKFSERYQITFLTGKEKVLNTLLRAYREFSGGTTRPAIAIVDWKGVSTEPEFSVFRDFFEQHGCPTIIADPRELEYTEGKLHKGDFTIDLVYKRALIKELSTKMDEVAPFIKACASGDVCVANPFRCKLVDTKLLFAILSDEKYQKHFSAEERSVIERHIPWTRRLRQGHTVYHGQRVDLCPFVLDHKDHLVLKPNDEYGGKGICIGWEATPSEWEQAFHQGLAAKYVVQERVSIPTAAFPDVSDGLTFRELRYDLNPYIFDGEVGGCLTRLSNTTLLNVTSGGGIVPTFIIS
jgi:hypothetical protein